ncbi:trypsin-like serine protease [Pseudomonas sp. DSP3-2-2]|uniref:trypsin-like serine protease n=1 Tax=unclassified Pseudomonas TaxID=196821 RepID=UPI003CE88651
MTRQHWLLVILLGLFSDFYDGAVQANEWRNILTRENMLKISPRASSLILSGVIDKLEVIDSAGVNSNLRIQHYLAQIFTETGGLVRLDENMMYSSAQLVRTFNSITPALAAQLEYRPKEIANYVYGDRLGNRGRSTTDGWEYRGSGYIQLTGRYNFQMTGRRMEIPLEKKPDLAREIKYGVEISLLYWQSRSINEIADRNDLKGVRRAINGPRALGYDASKLWFGIIRRVIEAEQETAELNDSGTGALQAIKETGSVDILRDLGFLPLAANESNTSPLSIKSALEKYQKSRSLRVTGIVDEDTLYSLVSQTEWTDSTEGEDKEVSETEESNMGVGYNLKNKSVTYFSEGDDAGPPSEPALVTGTGVIKPNNNASDKSKNSVVELHPIYAGYEIAPEFKEKESSFIPYSVIQPDTRTVIPLTTVYPNRAVVQIIFKKKAVESSYGCSGVMISNNMVLTAGHCVHDGATVDGWHDSVIVIPARNGPVVPYGECKATDLYSLKGWVDAVNSEGSRLYDIGAIRLDCKIGNRTGWVQLGSVINESKGREIVIMGYPCDKHPYGRQWSSSGRINELLPMKLFYQNDTFGCMSGAPVMFAGGASVIGVHTNGLHGHEPWSSNNAATRLTPRLAVIIREWIGQKNDN